MPDIQWFTQIAYDEISKATGAKSEIDSAIADLSESEKGKLVSIAAPRRLSVEQQYRFANSLTVMYDDSKIPVFRSHTKVETLSNDFLRNYLIYYKIDPSVTWGAFGWHPDAVVNPFKQISTMSERYPDGGVTLHEHDNVRDFSRWAWNLFSGFTGRDQVSVWENGKPTQEYPKSDDVFNIDNSEIVQDVIAGRWYTDSVIFTDGTSGDPESDPNAQIFGSADAVERPNGSKYLPRRLSSSMLSLRGQDKIVYYDVAAVQKARDAGIFVLLYGPPGTGKTALAEAALPGLISIEGTADTETADFVGSYVQTGPDSFEWVDGPLVTAMEEGRPLLIDEVALIDTRMMAVVYSVMDGRGEVNVTANPTRGVVKAKEGFYVIGACNPDVPGAIMSDALLSRFSLQFEMTTDYSMLSKLGVEGKIIRVAQNLARQVSNGSVMKAPQTRELLAYQSVLEHFGQVAALANLISTADQADRTVYKDIINSTFGINVEALTV